MMTGRVHSIQSLGAVDGPGLRSVAFLQGCSLRCAYCHNPDTWAFSGGTEMEAEQLVKKLLRFKPYWGAKCAPRTPDMRQEDLDGFPVSGGVTISGGEPLCQPDFVKEVFRGLHDAGIHTALDTSCAGDMKRAKEVLLETDLALVDLKFLTEEEYKKFCGGSLQKVQEFLRLTADMEIPIWIRHVSVPGITASPDYMQAVKALAENLPNLKKLEFLPFHNMCIEKYERLGIPFPLKDTKVMEVEKWNLLLEKLK